MLRGLTALGRAGNPRGAALLTAACMAPAVLHKGKDIRGWKENESTAVGFGKL